MPDIKKVWFDFLSSILADTFGEFISKEEIVSRCNWIILNLSTFDPDIIYKNILYMMYGNSLSEIAIGYKLHFILDDYKELFKAPYSEEFDRNPNLSESDRIFLKELIHNFSKSINHHIELIIHDSNYSLSSITNLIDTVKELTKYYKLPNYEAMSTMHIRDNNIIYKMDIGQILYMVSFNQNPITLDPCPKELALTIKNSYPNRLMMMDALKAVYPDSSVIVKYARSKKIF
jgi:hypothetical protein